MVAEDHADSRANAAAIYGVIRKPLMAPNVSSDKKLPLVYVIDSILKNVKGNYIPVIEEDAKTWMPIVYQALPEDKRAKLKKVWNLWKDANIFAESKWQEMGSCFSGASAAGGSSDAANSNPELEKAGITWGVRADPLGFILRARNSACCLVSKLNLCPNSFFFFCFFRRMGLCCSCQT